MYCHSVFDALESKIKSDIQRKQYKAPQLYIHAPTIKHKFEELKSAFPQYHIHYAIKANDDEQIISYLGSLGSSFEVASTAELKKLLKLHIAPDRIITSNPIKTIDFIEHCCAAGINAMAVDSREEALKIKKYHPQAQQYMRLEIENPESEWPLSDKFGLQPDEVDDFLLFCKLQKINLCGVTFHAGSQNNSVTSYIAALQSVKQVFAKAAEYGFHFHILNLGGGLPVDYTSASTPVAQYATVIKPIIDSFDNRAALCVQIEPGRRLVAEAGVMVAKVIGKAMRKQMPMIYINVGVFNGLIESIGGIKFSYVIHKTTGKPKRNIILAGPSCDSMDIIDRNVLLPEPDIDDHIFVLSAGAYTTVYAANFNGHAVPEINFCK